MHDSRLMRLHTSLLLCTQPAAALLLQAKLQIGNQTTTCNDDQEGEAGPWWVPLAFITRNSPDRLTWAAFHTCTTGSSPFLCGACTQEPMHFSLEVHACWDSLVQLYCTMLHVCRFGSAYVPEEASFPAA